MYDAEAAAKKAVKESQAALDTATLKKYGDFTEADVKQLVLDKKWADIIETRVVAETEDLTLSLVARVKQIGERYAETVSSLESELRTLDSAVADHLSAMGIQ